MMTSSSGLKIKAVEDIMKSVLLQRVVKLMGDHKRNIETILIHSFFIDFKLKTIEKHLLWEINLISQSNAMSVISKFVCTSCLKNVQSI
jgi:hypothetical protein